MSSTDHRTSQHGTASGTAPSPSAESGVTPYVVAVRDELIALWSEYNSILPPTLIEIGKAALAGPGKVMAGEKLATNSFPRWPMYVLLAFQAAADPSERGSWRRAVPVAAAVEVAIASTDLLDDIADADPSPIVAHYGPGQALNTAHLLLTVAEQHLVRFARGDGGDRALDALGALLDMGIQAALGQHLDMLYALMSPDAVTLEMSAAASDLKAGALIAGVCRMGASIAGAPRDVVEMVGAFGREVGGIAQIINDIQDVIPSEAPVREGESVAEPGPQPKTDLKLRKRTLPIVFALRDDSPEANALQVAYSQAGASLDEDALRRAVVEAGGVQFAQLIIEVHRQNALDILTRLEALRPGAREILLPLLPGGDAAEA